MKIALCQINPTVGDLPGNSQRIIAAYKQSVERGRPDLAVFPECALTGYPPEDLLFKDHFIRMTFRYLKSIVNEAGPCAMIVGFVAKKEGKLFNSAAVVRNKKIIKIVSKQSLPNYGVFDEKRYFSTEPNSGLVNINGIPIGISICEDLWETDLKINPLIRQAKKGAKLLVNISASPFYAGKFHSRLSLLKKRVQQTRCPILYANMVGGQDELLYDGRSMVLDSKGKLVLLSKSFQEDLKFIEFETPQTVAGRCRVKNHSRTEPLSQGIEEIYQALLLGTKDYVEKNNFKSVAIGLSGGIDSSLVAALAVDALGPGRVLGVSMPSQYSSKGTKSDAKKIAENLGIKFLTISIEQIFKHYLKILAPIFRGTKPNIAEENLQSRIRGTLLMALSNKFGHLVLTTGNKSEVSVGYCTLYGDTAGGFAILKDVPKTVVFQLSKYVNQKSKKDIIPETVLSRAPTAELKPHQTDQDTLPPYPLLDRVVRAYVEKDKSFNQLVRQGFKSSMLERVIRMVDANEYKRRQSPPGIKITPKSFGKDRRMPITNRFVEWR